MRTLAVSLIFMATLAQTPEPTGVAAVIEALLFGFEMAPASRTIGLQRDVARSLATYRNRARLFKPTIPPPADLDGPMGDVYFKRVGIERALFCLLDRPDSLRVAEEFATQVAVFSEWEGFADGPFAEAASADDYLNGHPHSAAAPYVQLFAGHRKLCAVDGMDGLDPGSDRGRRIAREAAAQIEAARSAGHPLLRIVADDLLATRKCFGR